MKLLSLHAHFDDFEFVAGGLFTVWKKQLGVRPKVIVCTDGRAGHQFRTREETGRLRLAEQEASARAGGFEFEALRYPNGEIPREACLQVSVPLLAALWKAIRDWEPDYLFCPPVPSDPLAGIHNDHVTVADAIRRVAYMINVPHAFTPEYPVDETTCEPCKVPVILTVYDGYMAGANAYDLAIDVDDVFDKMCRMSWCHQSQISEWLPWVGRHNMQRPKNLEEWSAAFRERFVRRNKEMGVNSKRIHEFFTVTAWGDVPIFTKIVSDFPNINKEASNLDALREKLRRWRGE
jgi:LmbE family N-acetylglucosaminyl deacetylase